MLQWLKSHTAIPVGALLLGLVLICYANSFRASWQYDDFNNIVQNSDIHMTEWSWTALRQAMGAGLDFQKISRPLAYLSFAVNYRFGGDRVLGYHIVNFGIHWMAALFLFLLIRGTLELPIFNDRYRDKATLIAFLAAALWASHPIHVSAVTYIVQRMASMAGMFYILSLYLFMVGRRSSARKTRIAAFIGCGLAGLAAVSTKENSVVLPYTLMLYDLLFFKPLNRRTVTKSVLMALGITLAVFALSFLFTNPLKLFEPYTNRPWTMAERVLTQPRVLFFYLSLLAVPGTSRMSILHDIAISHSLTDPWTTGLAIAGMGGLLLFLIWLIPRHRLFAFCGFFFFLNHLVESSILNLELIYEHRNYIPAMLVFVPIIIFVIRSIEILSYRYLFKYLIYFVFGLALFSQLFVTILYNNYFNNEFSIWLHAVVRYPKLSLAHNNLGKSYWEAGIVEKAYSHFKEALNLNHFNSSSQKSLVYYNIGIYYAQIHKNYLTALNNFNHAFEYANNSAELWYNLARMQLILGHDKQAKETLEEALNHFPNNAHLLNSLGVILLKEGLYCQAQQYAKLSLQSDKTFYGGYITLGEIERRKNNMVQATAYYSKFIYHKPKDLRGIMALIELKKILGKDDEKRNLSIKLASIIGYPEQKSNIVLDFDDNDLFFCGYLPDRMLIKKALSEIQK